MRIKLLLNTSIKITLGVFVFLSTLPALSAIPYRNAFEADELINNRTKELNLSFFARVQVVVDARKFDMTKFIPFNELSAYDNGGRVASKIFKQTLKNLIDEDSEDDALIISNARQVDSKVSAEIGNGQHKVIFRLRAYQAKALVVYKGYVNAELSYEIDESEVKLQVSKKLGSQTYAFTHNHNSDGISDTMGVRWSF